MEINFYEINFHVDKFARTSRFLGLSAKICISEICLILLFTKINPSETFVTL